MDTRDSGRAIPPGAAGKALVRRLVEEGVNRGELAIVDEVLAPTVPGLLPGDSGSAGVKKALATYRGAVPDAHWTITDQVAEGERVVSFFVASGTQHGPLWGLPATGRPMAVSGILMSRCQGGVITEQRLQLDLLGLLQQLGVMPELGLEQEVMVARVLHETRSWAGDRKEGNQ